MVLTADQRHALLFADRSRDIRQIISTVDRVLATNPDITLFDVETAFRDAAAQSYVTVSYTHLTLPTILRV